MSNEKINRDRLIFSFRLQFSPESQPIIETAREKIIERALFIEQGKYISPSQIEKIIKSKFPSDITLFSLEEIKSTLEDLQKRERLKKSQGKYKLSDQVISKINEQEVSSSSLIEGICNKVFEGISEPKEMVQPFYDCLCEIFAVLGTAYADLINDQTKYQDLLKALNYEKIVKSTSEKWEVESEIILSGVNTFFKNNDPQFNELKWNLAQNYYLVKLMGIDREGLNLSVEIFKDTTIYLDTNILVHALETSAERHESFIGLVNTCTNLGIQAKVLKITYDELRLIQESYTREFNDLGKHIPSETLQKMSGTFAELYLKARNTYGKKRNLAKLAFSVFDRAAKKMRKKFGVEYIDARDTSKIAKEEGTIQLAKSLRNIFERLRKKQKPEASALHDAIAIRFIRSERDKIQNKKIWFVTLDSTLPLAIAYEKGITSSPVITLDALLQWVSPLATGFITDSDQLQSIFAESLKYQLLPRERFFDLGDFNVFRDLDISCGEMPAEDVESCLTYLKNKGLEFDPSTAEGREKIHWTIKKYFADPKRAQNQKIRELEEKNKGLDSKLATSQQSLLRLQGIVVTFVYLVVLIVVCYLIVTKVKNLVEQIAIFTAFSSISTVVWAAVMGKNRMKALSPFFERVGDILGLK